MIIPILNGLLGLRHAPATWLLFLLNAAVFLGGVVPTMNSQSEINRYLDDDKFLNTQGRVFSQYILIHKENYSPLLLKLAERGSRGDQEKLKLLGTLAVRNPEFMEQGIEFAYHGDEVEISRWREKVKALQSYQQLHPSYVLGLTADDLGLQRWLCYIFVHSGAYHFVGNMYFLLIFGSMLEPVIGSLAVLVVFLLSGMVGAGVFLLLSGPTAAPLIGASGAVSGLMALFSLFFWRVPVRHIYFLLPSANYVGMVYLPAWVVLAMFGLSDLTGYWGAVNDFGGVAYAAHLGGEAMAFLVGFIVYLMRFRKPERWVKGQVGTPPVGHFVSIADMVEILKERKVG